MRADALQFNNVDLMSVIGGLMVSNQHLRQIVDLQNQTLQFLQAELALIKNNMQVQNDTLLQAYTAFNTTAKQQQAGLARVIEPTTSLR